MNKDNHLAPYQPHNSFFQHVYSHPEVVADLLRARLSEKLLAKLDLTTLKEEPKEFLPSIHRNDRRTDLLYSMQRQDASQLYIWLLLEHQSSHELHMAARLYEYHAAIFRKCAEQAKSEKNYKVPAIITLVTYHGADTWTSAKSMAELLNDFDFYVQEGLKRPFLIELPNESTQQILQHGHAAFAELALKHRSSTQELKKIMPSIFKLATQERSCCLDASIRYLDTVYQGSTKHIIEAVTKFDPEIGTHYKTMFEKDIKRAEKKGMEKGINLLVKKGLISKQAALEALKP